MSEVEFRVLGPLQLNVSGRPVPLRGMKHQIVLGSLLTAEGQRTSIGRLVDSVWGIAPPNTAGKQIRNAVSDLRNILAPSGAAITPVADGYRLDIGEARLDLHEFRRHLARARTHLGHGRKPDAIVEFRAALSLWTGPMLSGIESTALQAQIAGVNEGRLSVAEECIDLELAQDRHKSLVSELAAWVAEYPLRERMVAQYILALHRSGARARAFTVYEQARRNLADSLGLSPGPELLDVHQLMLREDSDAAAPPPPSIRFAAPGPAASVSTAEPAGRTTDAAVPVPDSLPFESGHFVGRAAEIDALMAGGTAPGTRRVLSVDGMGGVGKTTLSVYVAHRLADRYPDGRIFLDLCGHSRDESPLGHQAALSQLLLLSGLPESELPDSVEALVQMWRARTADHRMLVVLDNASGAEQIGPLLPAGDDCLTLITSRRRLTMTAVSPTRVVSLDPMSRGEGYALFCRLLGKRHPEPDLDEVTGILDICGDLPLAVVASGRTARGPRVASRRPADRVRRPHRLLRRVVPSPQPGTTAVAATPRHGGRGAYGRGGRVPTGGAAALRSRADTREPRRRAPPVPTGAGTVPRAPAAEDLLRTAARTGRRRSRRAAAGTRLHPDPRVPGCLKPGVPSPILPLSLHPHGALP